MIFTLEHCEMILAGKKTQTRRIARPFAKRGWAMDRSYAVQPGRGKRAVAYIAFRCMYSQQLQDITDDDVRAEGYETREAFAAVWDRINAKRGYPWASNPWVWVIEFRLEAR